MTAIWLPLVKGGGSPNWAGQPVLEATCSAADPTQVWAVPAGGSGPLKHVASGLCVAGTAGQPLVLTDCAGAPAWEVRGDGTISSCNDPSCCQDWNAADDLPHSPGNPIIAFTCGSPPAWNELWAAPAGGTSGLIRAAQGYHNSTPTLCAAVAPPPPQPWALPWNPAWKLADY